MKVIDSIEAMRDWSRQAHRNDNSVGLVPTMGFLHEGHLSLIRAAREQSERVVVSIYVNPTQFAPGEDLDDYPRDFERDSDLCRKEGVEAIFYPSGNEMYPQDFKTYVEARELSGKLCGGSRPIHFRGVTTIVAKLFNIVEPDVAVFGQKDAQQAIILKRMTRDLNFPVTIIIAPTVRESDGLAMSSRNKYLTSEQRRQASVLYRSLLWAKQEFERGTSSPDEIRRHMMNTIRKESSAIIDYVQIVNTDDLTENIENSNEILIALAVFFGKARLIDNIILKR